jgi:23S rRNA (pseudouridine1915-N3)-methyltransferase
VKIRLVVVGKLANSHLKALAEDYRERLKRLCDLEIVELKDAAGDAQSRLGKEAEKIREAAAPLRECVLCDEAGEEMDSRALSRFLEKRESASVKRLTFIIGSSHGIDAELKKSAPKSLALSRFTFTHEWARVLLLEQIYRAQCIKKNIPYHH